jgi:hypothetical protein
VERPTGLDRRTATAIDPDHGNPGHGAGRTTRCGSRCGSTSQQLAALTVHDRLAGFATRTELRLSLRVLEKNFKY